jgi:hypothetical protein
MSLSAPLAVPVEVRASQQRVFRLSHDVGESGLTLERRVPFEIGQRVTIAFSLPSAEADGPPVPVTLRAEVALTVEDGDGDKGGRALSFTDPPHESRHAIGLYVAKRLGLPATLATRP